MMRITTFASLLGAAALAAVAGCTVKDVDQPQLAGPSTFAHSITMVADRSTLTQNGSDFTDIRITSLGPNGESENVPLRAQIMVDGVAVDYGTLSTKTPITPTTVRYTAPPASTLATGQVPTRVTIVVTPTNNGDFRSELSRQVEIQLQPQGVILPINPNLVANFTVTPPSPQPMQTATFDASTSTNKGVACGISCAYTWNFGDGTSGSGITTTHQFRTQGSFPVTLTVTDLVGATAQKLITVTTTAPTPPTAVFTTSPATPGVNQEVFFDAGGSRPAPGRTITNYDWSFGDGTTGTGSVTAHRFTAPGNYQVSLTTTDDAGAKSAPANTSLQVGQSVGPAPVATMTCLGGDASDGKPATCNASASAPGSGATIASYTFNWGVGEPNEVHTNPLQSHLYHFGGTFTVTLVVTDSLGRTAATQTSVTITP